MVEFPNRRCNGSNVNVPRSQGSGVDDQRNLGAVEVVVIRTIGWLMDLRTFVMAFAFLGLFETQRAKYPLLEAETLRDVAAQQSPLDLLLVSVSRMAETQKGIRDESKRTVQTSH